MVGGLREVCVKTNNTAVQRATCSVVLIEHDSVI